MNRSKNVLHHEVSHKDAAAQDLDREHLKSRGASKNVDGGEYDYAELDEDMKGQLTMETGGENGA
jgi:hypothetical protein